LKWPFIYISAAINRRNLKMVNEICLHKPELNDVTDLFL